MLAKELQQGEEKGGAPPEVNTGVFAEWSEGEESEALTVCTMVKPKRPKVVIRIHAMLEVISPDAMGK